MRKTFAFVVMIVLSAPLSAQVQPPMQNSGVAAVLREDQGFVHAVFSNNQIPFGVPLWLMMCHSAGHCTQLTQFMNDNGVMGRIRGFSIPLLHGRNWQKVTLYQLLGDQLRPLMSMEVNAYEPPDLMVAAYEMPLPATNPFQSSATFGLKIAGRFDPYSPATIYAEDEEIVLQPFESKQITNSLKESVIKLDTDLMLRLPPSFKLTICQFGECDTATVERKRGYSGRG